MGVPSLLVADLGVLPYSAALDLQREAARRRISGELDEDLLLLVEHPPVVTLGRSSKAANLVASPAYLASHGVELFEVERGGDVTFHGPGQLVGYPIIDLKRHRRDLHWYLRQVEEALIRAVAEFGIVAERNAGYTGVWVSTPPGVTSGSGSGAEISTVDEGRVASPVAPVPRKLASIGVHARDWVTWHGFALNVNTDLRYFDLIVPCGIAGVTMTSIAREMGAGPFDMPRVSDAVVRAFGQVFAVAPHSMPPSALFDVAAGDETARATIP